MRRPTVAFTWTVVVSVFAMLPTAVIAPIAWQDDSQITGFGRVLLTGDVSHGLTLVRYGEALVSPFVLGPVVSELLFRLGGHFGVRAGSIALAGVCAVLVHLVARRAAPASAGIAALLGLVFLFSYPFAQNYRSGRFDVLAIALVLLAVLLLMPAASDSTSTPSDLTNGRLALAATALGLALATWPTTVLLLPVWLLAAYERRRSLFPAGGSLLRRLPFIIVPGLVVAGGAALLVLRAAGGSTGSFGALASTLQSELITSAPAAALENASLWARLGTRAVDLARSALPDVAVVLGLAAVLVTARSPDRSRRRAILWGVALLLVATGVLVTGPYIHRYVYFSASALVATAMLLGDVPPASRRLLRRVLVVLLPVLVLLQLVVRPALAVKEWDDRSPAARDAAMAGITCSLGERVYLDAFRFAYHLRSAGCRVDRLGAGSRDVVLEHLLRHEAEYSAVVLSGSAGDWLLVIDGLRDRGWEFEERGGGAHYRSPIILLRRSD